MGATEIPVPFILNGETIREVQIRPFTGGVIADTKKVLDQGNPFDALAVFITGCLESMGEVRDRAALRAAVGKMPYKTADYLICQIATQDGDDGVEGAYPCPRCDEKVFAEYNANPDLDTRDHLGIQGLTKSQDPVTVELILKTPVEIPADGDPLTITALTFDLPTLDDCSTAFRRVGRKDEIRLQFAIYLAALRTVNGEAVDAKWKTRYGSMVFEKMSRADLLKLGKDVNRYGIDTAIRKICHSCGKEFTAELNTSSFFGFALRQM